MPHVLSKTAFAAHAGVAGSQVSRWIKQGLLKWPALRADGLVDVELADRQLAEAEAKPRRQQMKANRVEAATPNQARAALLAGLFGEMETGFFPRVVAEASLSLSQRDTLATCWYRFRVKASQRG